MYNNFNYTKQFDKHIKANMESSNQFDKIIKEICKNKCKMSKIRHSKRIREDKKLELADNIKNKEDELIHNLLYYVKYNQISDKSFVDTLGKAMEHLEHLSNKNKKKLEVQRDEILNSMMSYEDQKYYMRYIITNEDSAANYLWDNCGSNVEICQTTLMKLIYTQQYIISCIMSIGNTYLMSGLGITDEKSQEIDDYIKSMQDALNEIKNHKIEYYSNEAQEQQQSVTQIIELWNTIQNSEQGHMPPSMILEIAKTIRLLKDKIPKQYKNKDWYDDEKQTDINIASCLERMNN